MLFRSGNTAEEWKKTHPAKEDATKEKTVEPLIEDAEPAVIKSDAPKVPSIDIVPVNRIVSIFKEALEKDAFYSSMFVQVFDDEVRKHSELLNYMKDKDSREDYIQKHQLREFFYDKELVISRMEDCIDSYIDNFVVANFNANELPNRSGYETKLRNILEEKISERKDVLDEFRNRIFDEDFATLVAKRFFSGESIVINVAVSFLVVCLIILIILLIRKANKKKKTSIVRNEIVTHGIFGIDGAAAFYHSTLIEHRLCECGFSRALASKQGDVFDFVSGIDLHGVKVLNIGKKCMVTGSCR